MIGTPRTLFAALVLTLAGESCRRADPIGAQARVVRNLQNLVAQAVEVRRGDLKGRFTGTEAPLPPGEPWLMPARYAFPSYLELTPGQDGLFHEQYEIVVDPNSLHGPHMELVPLPCERPDAGQPPDYGPNLELLPCTRSARTLGAGVSSIHWCTARAVGRFGAGDEIWEISTRVVAQGDHVVQEPMVSRRVGR
jgi:hypothetical protein